MTLFVLLHKFCVNLGRNIRLVAYFPTKFVFDIKPLEPVSSMSALSALRISRVASE